jgi:carbamoyl-phosphate synthase large subunit
MGMGNILFLTCVDRYALISEMKKYIFDNLMDSKIIVVSDNKYCTSQHIVDDFILLPPNEDMVSLLEFLKQVILGNNIVGFFVAVNFGVELISELETWLKDNNVIYFASSRDALGNCLSKKRLFNFLSLNRICTPYTYTDFHVSAEDCLESVEFPAIIKPDIGYGSKKVFILHDFEELQFYSKKIKNPVIQEYIKGEHYTVDCFNDINRQLRICVPRRRVVINGANSIVCEIVDNQKINEIAQLISGKISIVGPWNFQVIKTNDRYFTHDINPRAAGGMMYSIMSGVPLQKYIVDTLLGIDIKNWDYIIKNSTLLMYKSYAMI